MFMEELKELLMKHGKLFMSDVVDGGSRHGKSLLNDVMDIGADELKARIQNFEFRKEPKITRILLDEKAKKFYIEGEVIPDDRQGERKEL